MTSEQVRALVAKNIRAAAKRQGMSLNSVADFAGVSRSQFYDVLLRRKSASVDWLAKVAATLDVEPWELLRR